MPLQLSAQKVYVTFQSDRYNMVERTRQTYELCWFPIYHDLSFLRANVTNDFNANFLFENLDFQAILGFVRSEQLLLFFN